MKDLNSYYTIPEELITEFRQKGHTLTPGLLTTEEASQCREVIANAAMKHNQETRKLEDRDTYGKAFLQVMNLWRRDEETARFVLARRFAKVAADILGVSKVRLYHDQALFKEAGGGPTPWHQDQYYWPVDTTDTVTMWMPLVDINEEMGMLTFASGSHHDGQVFDKEISDESEDLFRKDISKKGYDVTRSQTMNAGDATWHYGYTIHSAPGNESDQMRSVMTVIFVADGARVTEPENKNQEADRKTWLAGLAPGSRIDSELNPLLL